ncbi:hypothetical protein, partial [Tanticharoenia sakaeratensis]|uniref:hypothetical protein n=1 Tax=Tanticharoenia sakaeratensis TaxID=444053 RepID=UPI00222F87E9
IINQMKAGESGQSIANNLNALAKQASASGDSSLAGTASSLASQAAGGTMNTSTAEQTLASA